ncbi:phage/plasmid primase, P4 family [Micromonospora sp. NPDC050417]|uniref:DNA primase family protein n=1 Tax=Micromonospora sp. NPDC050417 TaxID=3364280 RepID=UPI00379DDA4C
MTTAAPIGHDGAAVMSWLRLLHGDSPGHVSIVSTDDWAGQTFPAGQLDQAAAYVAQLDAAGREGIYLRVTSLTRPPEPGRRAGADQSAALPALWADLDIAGPGHAEQDLPPDEAAGRAVIAATGLPEPTIWIHSGGGLYPIWLLDQPWALDASNLDAAKALAKGWQAVIEHAAASLGWRYGRGVGDLARVLRIPGTTNRKEGLARPCRIIGAAPNRYTVQQLQAALDIATARIAPPEPAVTTGPSTTSVTRPAGDLAPGADFNARATWPHILEPAGWREHYRSDDVTYWTRPGKPTGTSASTNALGTDRLHIFTTSAAHLEGGESYSKFGAYAVLNHGGDHSAAARALGQQGYGTPLPEPGHDQAQLIADILGVDLSQLPVVASRPGPPPPGDLYTEIAAIADAPAEQQAAVARELIRRVAALDATTRQDWRDAIRQVVPAISRGDFEVIVREERRAQAHAAKEAARQRRQQELADQLAAAEQAGALMPSPSDPMAVARVLVTRLPATDGVPHLIWWRGDFYEWNTAHWVAQKDAAINRWLYLHTENARYDAGDEVKRWQPNIGKIANLRDALGSAILARPWDEDDDRGIVVTNGVLKLEQRHLAPHTPKRFNLTSLPFAYDPDATCTGWEKFLNQVLPDDQEAQEFLGEWFGYVVSGRTDLQKIASLFGARRSGKGTIARILEALLGPEATAAPSLTSLLGTFGEQPLIGKSLAVLSDVNWGIRDIGEAVEIVKKISGEDSRDVHRKNREAWHGKLGVRFMFLGNDMPKFTDASGALAGRMIHVKFGVSFYGKEDPGLTDRLMEELPGILNWALDGLDRLTKRGHFTPPASSRDSEREIMRLTSPVYGFIEDRAIETPEAEAVLLDDLFTVYRDWCAEEEGRDRVSTKAIFARDLRSVGNGSIQVRREQIDGVRAQRVYGLAPQEPNGFKPRNRWLAGIVNHTEPVDRTESSAEQLALAATR